MSLPPPPLPPKSLLLSLLLLLLPQGCVSPIRSSLSSLLVRGCSLSGTPLSSWRSFLQGGHSLGEEAIR